MTQKNNNNALGLESVRFLFSLQADEITFEAQLLPYSAHPLVFVACRSFNSTHHVFVGSWIFFFFILSDSSAALHLITGFTAYLG
jgi:hypothetical protein